MSLIYTDVNFEKRQGDLSTLGNEDHGRRLGLLCVVQMVGNHSSSQPVNRKWTRTAGVVCVRIQVGPSCWPCVASCGAGVRYLGLSPSWPASKQSAALMHAPLDSQSPRALHEGKKRLWVFDHQYPGVPGWNVFNKKRQKMVGSQRGDLHYPG